MKTKIAIAFAWLGTFFILFGMTLANHDEVGYTAIGGAVCIIISLILTVGDSHGKKHC